MTVKGQTFPKEGEQILVMSNIRFPTKAVAPWAWRVPSGPQIPATMEPGLGPFPSHPEVEIEEPLRVEVGGE